MAESDFLVKVIEDGEQQTIQQTSKGFAAATSIEDELQCSICFEILDEPVTPACGHTFCQGCLRKWQRQPRSKSSNCPICDKPLPQSISVNVSMRRMVKAYHAQKAQMRASEDAREQELLHAWVPASTAVRTTKEPSAIEQIVGGNADELVQSDLLPIAQKLKALLEEQPQLQEIYDACVTDGPMNVDEFIASFGE